MKFEWKQNRENEVLRVDESFYVSFNPMDEAPMEIDCFRSDNNQSETALIISGEFRILNGDFRDEYFEIFNKFESDAERMDAAVKFYQSKNKAFGSSWSTENNE